MGPAGLGMPQESGPTLLFPRQPGPAAVADPFGLRVMTGPAYGEAPYGVRPRDGYTFELAGTVDDGQLRAVPVAPDGAYNTNYALVTPRSPRSVAFLPSVSIVDTGRVRDDTTRQFALPGFQLPDRDSVTGWVPRPLGSGDRRSQRPSRASKSQSLPNLIAGLTDEIEISPAESYGGNVRYTLTREDLLRGASTPEEVEQRLRIWSGFARANPGNRVPRSIEQAEAPRQPGVLNRQTGLPDDRPVYLRGGSLADQVEAGVLNTDKGGTRSIDASGERTLQKGSAELHPFGTVPVVMAGPGGRLSVQEFDPTRLVETWDVDPDNTAAFLRTEDASVGDVVEQVLQEAQTPVVRGSELLRRGFTPLEQPDGTLVGNLSDGTPVYAPVDSETGSPITGASGEQLFRLGSPTSRNADAIRAGVAPVIGGSFQMVPDTGTSVGAGGLEAGLRRGFTFSPGRAEGGDLPLFNITTPEQAKAYVRSIVKQSGDHPLVTSLYAMDSTGRPVQLLQPAIGADGLATGHFNPVRSQWIGPAALMPGDSEAAIAARKGAEKWGARPAQYGGGGLNREDVSLVGLASNLQKGAFMQKPVTVENPLARMIASGQLPVETLEDPRLASLFPPGSQARIRLNQDVIAAGGVAPFTDGLLPVVTRQASPGVSPFQAFTATPLPPRETGPVQRELVIPTPGGSSLQRAMAQALFGPPSETRSRPSGRRAPLPVAPEPAPQPVPGEYVVDADGQMRVVTGPLPNRFAPDPADAVAAYMAAQAKMQWPNGVRWTQARPLEGTWNEEQSFPVFRGGNPARGRTAAPQQGGYIQPGLLPRIGEEVRRSLADVELPVGRAAGPYARAPYYGIDLDPYQRAATARGAARGFDYGAMAAALGDGTPRSTAPLRRVESWRPDPAAPGSQQLVRRMGDVMTGAPVVPDANVGSPEHERAMRQLAMRLRNRAQSQTLGPVDWRAALPSPVQGLL